MKRIPVMKLKPMTYGGLAVLFAACACFSAGAVDPAAVEGVAAVQGVPPQIDTFFASNLGQAILTAIGGVASAGFLAFTGTEFYKTRTNFVTRRIAEFIAAAVAQTYATKVREWKAKSPTGSLTLAQKTEAENAAMSLARGAAEHAGLANHPMVADAALLRGAVVVAVSDAKAGILRDRKIRTTPSTKGA